ncbi:MFS transporter, partial [bacterium]|nr:MFS transporter [bacterium]
MGKGFPYFLVIVALSGVLGRLVGFFIPVYFKSIGLTPTQTGLYFAVSSIASIILSLPMGISTDRVKIAWLLTASFLLAALSYLGLIFTETFWVFCTFALAGSFAGRLYTIANNTFFFKTAGDDSRRATGIYQFVMFASIGLGMWLGGMLIDRFTFRFVFVLSLLGNLALMAFSCFLPHNATVEITLDEYRKSVWTPRVLLICAVFFLSSLHYGAEMVSYSPFLKDVLHLS